MPTSLNTMMHSVREFFRFAHIDGLIPADQLGAHRRDSVARPVSLVFYGDRDVPVASFPGKTHLERRVGYRRFTARVILSTPQPRVPAPVRQVERGAREHQAGD